MTEEAQRAAIAKAMGIEARQKLETGKWFGRANDGWVEVPDYLRDLNASASLCAVLAKRGWNCTCENGLDTTWECTFDRPRQESTKPENAGISFDGSATEEHYGCGDTLALAICQSFLRALNLWIE